MAARLAARSRAACSAAGLTEPRCATERGLAMGGGRPTERRFTVGGSGKSVARCHRTVLAYWKFESISLQGRVQCELPRTNFETKSAQTIPPPVVSLCEGGRSCLVTIRPYLLHPFQRPNGLDNGEAGVIGGDRLLQT